MKIIGITGPTGAGKTTALREIEKLGGAVIDCDAVYHQMLESDTTLQEMLEQTFGSLRDEMGRFERKRADVRELNVQRVKRTELVLGTRRSVVSGA